MSEAKLDSALDMMRRMPPSEVCTRPRSLASRGAEPSSAAASSLGRRPRDGHLRGAPTERTCAALPQ
eukprot:COSAG06_NODE_33195_length_493_cov_4.994924_1_plen_66_part_01